MSGGCEALANAIVHRDYQNPSDIQIKIFVDRITIYNPGKLYGNLTVGALHSDNYQSELRNKLVAEAFYLTGAIEKYGSGMTRIRKEVAKAGDVTFFMEETSNGFLVTFAKTAQKNRPEKPPGKTARKPARETLRNQILEILREDPTITRAKLAEKLQKGQTFVKEQLADLKKEGIIIRLGSDRKGEWRVALKSVESKMSEAGKPLE